MSYWSNEIARLERLARKALAAKRISEAKLLLRIRNAQPLPPNIELVADGLMPTGLMFRQMVHGQDEEGLNSEFWLSLAEARHMLACLDLATLPMWDAIALLEALTLGWDEHTQSTRSGMSKQQIERRISLAQSSGQLALLFRAKDGLAWAERMGIEFTDPVLKEAVEKISPGFDGTFEEQWRAIWGETETESQGSDNLTDNSSMQRRDKLRVQEQVIINWLKTNNFDPENLPYVRNGYPGVRAAARNALDKQYPFVAKTAFTTAWQRLRDSGEINDQTK